MSSIPDAPYGMESLLLGNILEADDDDNMEFFNNARNEENRPNTLFRGLAQDRPSSAPPSLFINNVNVCHPKFIDYSALQWFFNPKKGSRDYRAAIHFIESY